MPLAPADRLLLSFMKQHKADAEAGAPLLTFAEAAALPTVAAKDLTFRLARAPPRYNCFADGEEAARERLFKRIPWVEACVGKIENCIIAGGAVHGELTRNYYYADIDLFVFGMTASDADGVLQKLIPLVRAGCSQPTSVAVTGGAITVQNDSGWRPVQVIRLITPSATAVLHGFDLAASAVGFDLATGKFLFTRLGALAVSSNVAPVDVARCSKTFESRLVKYQQRGVTIVFPQLALPVGCHYNPTRLGRNKTLELKWQADLSISSMRVAPTAVSSSYTDAEESNDSTVVSRMTSHFAKRLCAEAWAGDVDLTNLPALVRIYEGAVWGCGLGWVRKAVEACLNKRVNIVPSALSFAEFAAEIKSVLAQAGDAAARAAAAVAKLEALPTPPLWTIGDGINFGRVAITPAEWHGELFNGLDLDAE